MRIRFDPAAPYEVDEHDAPLPARGFELLARVYRIRGEPTVPCTTP